MNKKIGIDTYTEAVDQSLLDIEYLLNNKKIVILKSNLSGAYFVLMELQAFSGNFHVELYLTNKSLPVYNYKL